MCASDCSLGSVSTVISCCVLLISYTAVVSLCHSREHWSMCFKSETLLELFKKRAFPGCVPRNNTPLLAAAAAAEAAAELEPRPLDAAAAEAAAATAPQLPPAGKHQQIFNGGMQLSEKVEYARICVCKDAHDANYRNQAFSWSLIWCFCNVLILPYMHSNQTCTFSMCSPCCAGHPR